MLNQPTIFSHSAGRFPTLAAAAGGDGGSFVGIVVGSIVGIVVGSIVGIVVGSIVGIVVGSIVGIVDSAIVAAGIWSR